MPNQLKDETSPYLLQHADNPVDWHPWNDAALALAREQDRPILLSIGYSACHWCHVMAHESFEDADIAGLMNRHFVNIKVDREERPDLDRIYQLAHQLMAQRPGGWPLTVVLDPNTHAPFFAGTYFPPEPRHGMPAFPAVLQHVADWYAKNKDELADQDEKLREVFKRIEPESAPGVVLDARPLELFLAESEKNFDSQFGGFSDAPKFPHTPQLELLLSLQKPSPPPSPWKGEGENRSTPSPSLEAEGVGEGGQDMALFTLSRMCEGGLFDHLGGGFCRYSVDAQWMIPHFEKMLYDNGPLLALCCTAAQLDPAGPFARAAGLTADWALREMQSPDGGYYSSLDADSEGHEGKFYVWTRDEVGALLPDDYPLFSRRFGLDRTPNFEGQWHLHAYETIEALAREFGQAPAEISDRLEQCRRTLFARRAQRVHPGRDDKILTSWNALMVSGMAAAARTLGREDCLRSAQRAFDFIRAKLWTGERLLATYKDGRAHLNAYLDDYALLLTAALDLLQVEWRSEDLSFARRLADGLLSHYEDRKTGGFFFTAHDHEKLLARLKNLGDDAIPSGNAIAARALNRLGWLLAEPRYLAAAERTLKLGWSAMNSQPLAYPTLLMAVREQLQPPVVWILRGNTDSMREARSSLAMAPQNLVFAIPDDARELPDALAGKKPQGAFVAYRCQGMQCSAPIGKIEGIP